MSLPQQMNLNHLGIEGVKGRLRKGASTDQGRDASRRAWLTEKLQRDEAGDTGRVQLRKGLECHAKDCGFDPAGSKGQLKSSSREAPCSDLCIRKVALAVAVRDGGGEAEGGSAVMSPTGQCG